MEALLTINEVSQLTTLSVGTLYHLISQGRIPVVRISCRCVRFRASDIQQWIAEKVVPPLNQPCCVSGQKDKKRGEGKTTWEKPFGVRRPDREGEENDDE